MVIALTLLRCLPGKQFRPSDRTLAPLISRFAFRTHTVLRSSATVFHRLLLLLLLLLLLRSLIRLTFTESR